MNGFYLHGSADEKLRLKAFSSTSDGKTSIIKITLETADPYELAYALKCLSEVREGQLKRKRGVQPAAGQGGGDDAS